jgi:hypothetical protein
MHATAHTSEDANASDFFATLDTSDTFLKNTSTPSTFQSSTDLADIVQQLREKHLQLLVSSALQVNWRVFREGVSPCWEDPANASGGKWALSLVNVDASDALERFHTAVDSIVQGTFPSHQQVNGVVLSVKDWGYRLSLWTNSIPSKVQVGKGSKWLRTNLRPKYSGFYTHQSLMKKHASPTTSSSPVASGSVTPMASQPVTQFELDASIAVAAINAKAVTHEDAETVQANASRMQSLVSAKSDRAPDYESDAESDAESTATATLTDESKQHDRICEACSVVPIVGTRYHKIGEDDCECNLCEMDYNKLPEPERKEYEAIEATKDDDDQPGWA